jgi:hypothetical protein
MDIVSVRAQILVDFLFELGDRMTVEGDHSGVKQLRIPIRSTLNDVERIPKPGEVERESWAPLKISKWPEIRVCIVQF